MTEMTEQLAVIRGVKCGVGDYGNATLSFSTYISECVAALQVVGWDDAKKLIEDAGVEHVDLLVGKTCWVEVGNGMIIFKRLAKI